MVIEKIRQTLLSIERINRNTGGTQFVARMGIARALGVAMGTVDNIVRDRVKSISAELAIAINQLHIQTIEAEIARLENERELTLQFNATIVPNEVDEVEIMLETARARLRKLAKGRR